MKLAFMSSVFPKLDLAGLIAKAEEYGYAGIEFRPEWDHAHGLEPGADAGTLKAAREAMAAAGLEPCCISPGVKFCSPDEKERDAQFEKLLGYIDLAAGAGIPRIRIFGDPIPNGGRGSRAESYRVQAGHLARAAEKAEEASVLLCIETHSNFRAFDTGEVLFHAGYPPALMVNWHLGHCLRHGEGVDEAYRHVKGRVAHVHFSLKEEEAGDEQIERQIELLKPEAYDGFFSVEVINPDDGDAVAAAHAEKWAAIKKRLGI